MIARVQFPNHLGTLGDSVYTQAHLVVLTSCWFSSIHLSLFFLHGGGGGGHVILHSQVYVLNNCFRWMWSHRVGLSAFLCYYSNQSTVEQSPGGMCCIMQRRFGTVTTFILSNWSVSTLVCSASLGNWSLTVLHPGELLHCVLRFFLSLLLLFLHLLPLFLLLLLLLPLLLLLLVLFFLLSTSI